MRRAAQGSPGLKNGGRGGFFANFDLSWPCRAFVHASGNGNFEPMTAGHWALWALSPCL